MGVGTLTIYSASAGSGKTYILAGKYLEKLFTSRYSYRKILAVTFTHKATAEMKNRILDELNNLATGGKSKYLPDLIKSSGKSEESIRLEAKEILYSVLHDFSRFSVSTIDSFFQKILRAFARDIGLHSGFNIELDHSSILSSAVDKVIGSAASDPLIKSWLSMYVRDNIEDEKSWDLKKSIISLAEELFSEKFKLLSHEESEKLHNKDFLALYISEMRSISSDFKKQMKDFGIKSAAIYSKFGLTDEMFYQKGRGIPGFIRALTDGIIKPPNSYVLEIEKDPPRWSSGATSVSLENAIRNGLGDAVKDAIRYYESDIINYKSANVILSNIYALGILSDVLRQVYLITRDENIFLLSYAAELIYLITDKDQTPFIYEKVGNVFENFMIDEFQDTSTIQWKNFKPLIDNSMAQGFDNLVVGDVKQSIYRWRNSDWQILRDLKREVDYIRLKSEPLNTNWRSCSNIISFNNALFSIIPKQIDEELSGTGLTTSFCELYSEAFQVDPVKKDQGYVRIEFIEDTDQLKWQETVLNKIPGVIESLQENGYRASDIGILVRDNREGARVLKTMISYTAGCSPDKKNRFNYNIVSNDSLLLSNSPVLNFIIGVLKVLDNPKDMISRALMLRFFLLSTGKEGAESVPLISEELIELSSDYFPGDYESFLENVRYLPLWDVTEKTISFFKLGNYSFNVAYLNSFQDIVLNFSANKNPGILPFLEWWESDGKNKSVSLPEHQDAIRVLTIHKSKGLEFGVVIIPFLSWNMNHKSHQSNILWVRPDVHPFNKISVIPVKYSIELSETIFMKQYYEEKYSAYLDNINLLYVSLTRSKNAIFGFAPENPKAENAISSVIRKAINFTGDTSIESHLVLRNYFDEEKKVFEFGKIPVSEGNVLINRSMTISKYPVSDEIESLKLKLHGENYFLFDKKEIRNKINYGRLMHEIFEAIIVKEDVPAAVGKLVFDGKIPYEEAAVIQEKISEMLNRPVVKEWFESKSEVLNEASILMPGASTRRPDRIIFRNGKAIIIDFKFGEENPHYLTQIRQYRRILTDMGYSNIEAFLWYVDADKIISA